jgi:hypothetical protein
MTDTYDPDALAVAKVGLRLLRNEALALTDWAVLPDSPLDDATKTSYTNYRQYLRDLPSNTTDEGYMTFSGVLSYAEWNEAQEP